MCIASARIRPVNASNTCLLTSAMQLQTRSLSQQAHVRSCRTQHAPVVRALRCRSARQDALKQLEEFQTGVRGAVAVAAATPGRGSVAAAAAADTTVEQQTGLLELTQATYWDYLKEHADGLTVVDFYTAWCGPCKLILPDLVRMHEELAPKGVRIVKFECNKDNKELGKSLGIKVAPTFHLYKNSQKVAEMTGAKVDKLRQLIDMHMSGDADAE